LKCSTDRAGGGFASRVRYRYRFFFFLLRLTQHALHTQAVEAHAYVPSRRRARTRRSSRRNREGQTRKITQTVGWRFRIDGFFLCVTRAMSRLHPTSSVHIDRMVFFSSDGWGLLRPTTGSPSTPPSPLSLPISRRSIHPPSSLIVLLQPATCLPSFVESGGVAAPGEKKLR